MGVDTEGQFFDFSFFFRFQEVEDLEKELGKRQELIQSFRETVAHHQTQLNQLKTAQQNCKLAID